MWRLLVEGAFTAAAGSESGRIHDERGQWAFSYSGSVNQIRASAGDSIRHGFR